MPVLRWVGTVEVHVAAAYEATMFVLCMDVRLCNAFPRCTHPSLDVVQREGAAIQYTLSPYIEQGIVEWTEPLGRCSWDANDLRQILATVVMELLQHLSLSVNCRAVDQQNQRVHIQRSRRLGEQIVDVAEQHGARDAFVPLAW